MALATMMLSFTACRDDEETEVAVDPGIVGEWKATSAQFLYDEQDPAVYVKDLAESLNTSVKALEEAGMRTSIENERQDELGLTFMFEADKTYALFYSDEVKDSNDDNLEEGIWSVSEGNIIVLQADEINNDDTEYEVRSITKSRATLAYTQSFTSEDAMDFYGVEIPGGFTTTSLIYLER